MLLRNLQATEKVIDGEVVLNENHVLQAGSLKYDIKDAFESLYTMDPRAAFQLSQSHKLLADMVAQLDKVSPYYNW